MPLISSNSSEINRLVNKQELGTFKAVIKQYGFFQCFNQFLLFIYLLLYVYVYGYVPAKVHKWRSEDKLWKSVLSTRWIPEIKPKSLGSLVKAPLQLSHPDCLMLWISDTQRKNSENSGNSTNSVH